MGYLENDAEFQALALELLEEFGVPTVFTVRTGGAYDRATGTVVGSTDTPTAPILASPPLPVSSVFGAGSTIIKGTSVVFVAAADFPVAPELNLGLTHDGKSWTVVDRLVFNAGASPAAYAFGIETTS